MKLLLPAVLFTIALVMPAYAYLDPGTGSMILQAIIGGLAVASATLSVFWTRVQAFFASLFGKKTRS